MPVFYHGYALGVWYDQEAAEGVSDSSAPYLHLAHKSEVTISDEPNPVVVALSGSVDNAAIGKGIENPVVNITFNPSLASGADFIKNFSSTDNSFTMVIMIDAGTDVIFARMTGCKVKRMSPSVAIYPNHSALSVTAEIWGWALLYTASGGSPTFEAAPGSFVNWSNITVKKNAGTITDWWNFEWTVDNDLDRQPDNTGATVGIKRGRRDVTGSWTRSANDASGTGQIELDETKNATTMTLDVVIDLATDHTYTFTGAVNRTATVTAPISGMVGKKMDFVATSFSIA